jgi:hypothetical protein
MSKYLIKIAKIMIILLQGIILSSCSNLQRETTDTTEISISSLEGRITLVAPSSETFSTTKIEATIAFIQKYFEYLPLLNESLLSPNYIYYGCVNSNEAGVIMDYEIDNTFKEIYPKFKNEFNITKWTYKESDIIENELNQRIKFIKASTILDDSSIMDIEGTILEYLTNPIRLRITIAFSYVTNSSNYKKFENNPSNAWILSDPKSALLSLCSSGQWSVLNP